MYNEESFLFNVLYAHNETETHFKKLNFRAWSLNGGDWTKFSNIFIKILLHILSTQPWSW